MDAERLAKILDSLVSPDAEPAWSEFLEAYAPLILQVCRFLERDADHATDCFLFVCEHLVANRFARLRRYRPEGPASFPTWLRAVVRNLCLDWRRKQFGRTRAFESVERMSLIERQIFQCRFEDQLSREETYSLLHLGHPDVTEEQFIEIEERITASVSSRQQWLLSARRAEAVGELALAPATEDQPGLDVPDARPSPEIVALERELSAMLAGAVARLSKQEQLLLKLRFVQGLTLADVARLTGMANAQQADRRLRELLARLRSAVGA